MRTKNFIVAAFWVFGACLFFTNSSLASDLNSSQQTKILNISIPWSENQGQLDKSVKYSANTFMGTVFITDNGSITYSLTEKSAQGGASSSVIPSKSEGSLSGSSVTQNTKSVVVKEIPQFKITPTITGEEKTETKTNYFIGSDKSKWQSNVSTYNIVSLGNIYPNIKLQLKAHGNNVEKLYTVSPKGNPNDIKMKVEGAKKLTITKDGQLKVDVKGAKPIYFTKPIAYQDINGKRINVSVKYKLNNNTYSFILGKYNKEYPLIIDPELSVISASTYLGGSGSELTGFSSTAIDSSGNLFILGSTAATNFPTTIGVVSTTYGGGSYDVFISKFDSNLTTLLSSTYLGGNGDDRGYNLHLDSLQNVYATGFTASINFSTTSGAVGANLYGGNDVFITKLDNTLTSLVASTYLGGSGNDIGYSMDFDLLGNIIVTGQTASTNFPTTTGVVSTTYGGGNNDIFVSKLNSDFTDILASTYIGGSGDDIGYSIVLDSSNNVYVTGQTGSTNFPTTTGVVSTTYGGGTYDAFVLKLNSAFTDILVSTYLGGNGNDFGYFITLELGSVYIVGFTGSTNFTTTNGAVSTTYAGGIFDGFITKLSVDLSLISYSTYLGGRGEDRLYSAVIDASGNMYVVGYASSTDFPITDEVFNTSYNGGAYDGVCLKFDSNFNLLASTYFGGSGSDYSRSINLDSSGNVFVVGFTGSTNFPTTTGAYGISSTGGNDAFITKFGNPLPTITALSPASAMINDILTPITLTVVGTGFVPSTTVTFNGHVEATTHVSPTEITAVIPVSDLGVYDATLTVTVSSPLPGGGISNSAVFTTAIRSGSGSYYSPVPSSPSITTPSTMETAAPVTTPVQQTTTNESNTTGSSSPTTPVSTPSNVNSTIISKTTLSIPPTFAFKRNLRSGFTGTDVKYLQKILKSLGTSIYPEGKITGYFGPATTKAVKRLQSKYKLPSVGIFGPMTRGVVNGWLK